ncbi:hypothetical protein QL285_040186 [Trifolium repens]|nr:hypothetical protein QL285_040186 [Trifolium repens]
MYSEQMCDNQTTTDLALRYVVHQAGGRVEIQRALDMLLQWLYPYLIARYHPFYLSLPSHILVCLLRICRKDVFGNTLSSPRLKQN